MDTGYVKVKSYDMESGVDRLIVVPCGKSSADQRTGRAGRIDDGECYRIYTEDGYKNMPANLPAEILRSDLCGPILKLKGLGVADIMTF